ncbi:43863_t:CDS:2, partial [Gigaspora margarita]
MNNNNSDNNETISNTNKFKFLKPLTPQNYLPQTQLSNQFYKSLLPEIRDSNIQYNFGSLQTLVKENYPYIHKLEKYKSYVSGVILFEHSDSTTFLSLEKINLRYNHDIIELKFQLIAKNVISDKHLNSILYACEDLLISRDSLRCLAAVIPDMNHEHSISQQRIEINNIMSQKIPIN